MGRTEARSSGSLRRLGVPAAIVAPAAIVVLVVAVGGARAATVVSETTWGGSLSEVTNAAAVAPDGSVYLTGFTTSFDPFGRDNAFLVKFAADGTFSWQRTFHARSSSASTGGTASPSRRTAPFTSPGRPSVWGTTCCC